MAWACLPRFDSEPVFATLLDRDRGGEFIIGPARGGMGTQRYLPNTNILETRFEDADGIFRVLDFAPRFMQHERSFRPTKFVRIVEPISGTPRIRVKCDPILGWSKARPRREYGSHHVSFLGYDAELRLTTDAPISYVEGEPFLLTEKRHFVLAWGAPVEEPLEALCDRFFIQTRKYWQVWVKHLEVPTQYQEEVIRSALALKLHCFEDTGAIVAALTTSLPESPAPDARGITAIAGSATPTTRSAPSRLLGHFEEREQFLQFLLNVASSAPDLDLAPLYRIDGRTNLEESILHDWPGFEGEKPVRVGNGAATHQQFDVYGEMVLALTPSLWMRAFVSTSRRLSSTS